MHGMSVSLSPIYTMFLSGTRSFSGGIYLFTPSWSFMSRQPFSMRNRNCVLLV